MICRGISAITKENGHMSTTMDGLISINFATDKNGFNAGECLVNAFKKLEGKESLTFNEEYAIEALWHEILHNKSNNKWYYQESILLMDFQDV